MNETKGYEKWSIEDLERAITDAYVHHLINTGRLSRQEYKKGDFSRAMPFFVPNERGLSPESQRRAITRFVLAQVKSAIYKQRDNIEKVVCKKLQYCKRRDSEGLNILVTTLDGILSVSLGFPVPITMVATWLLKKKVFDEICECDQKAKGK